MRYLLTHFIKTHRYLLTATLLSSTTTYFIESVLIPRVLGSTFSHLTDLKKNLYILVLLWILTQVGNILIDYFNARVELELGKFLNHTVFHHLFIKYQHDHEHINTANVLDTLSSLQTNMQSILYRILISLLPRTLTIGFVLANITSIHPGIGYLSTVLIIVFFISVSMSYSNKGSFAFPMLQAQTNYLNKVTDVIENVEWISTTKHAIQKESESCHDMHRKEEHEKWKKQKSLLTIQSSIYGINIVIFSILLYYLYSIYQNGEISGEQVTSLLLSISPLFVNIYELLWYIPEFVQYISVYQFYNPYLSELFSFDSVSNHHVEFTPHSSIHVEDVSFRYGEHLVYDHISIVIPNGSFVTLRGVSGSGKSTFLKLLGGILKPSDGKITMDTHSIHEVSLVSLYQHMLYVHQHPTLFDDTVYYNISYGLEVQKAELESILQTYELTSYLPDLDARVGKGGNRMSGGQRQLIHLIRCVFSPARILLLDESMSAMDEGLATKMIRVLSALHQQGKTILLISHHETIFTKDVMLFENGVPRFV